ncbi:integral membrane protein sed5 [Coprinopsis cinerea okayama7|uniref:Integral membrane protein sed5 n=1 Tax=Coprinopsis cinerea (strain Okayama-7 / 130 / ATCC MYA-4618 / FGSC 9003) TaxID=240176 RepID=A8N2N7_COPC7|nr:integral membrane protein sed5 [Coprinopsis cinerea okayama7\|eukprot:XP_001829105.2 integral membrane protein sed5 [Coprinopsis cinerea okayama7\
MTSFQDRTTEFRTCVESIRSRSAPGARAEAKQRLLHQPNGKPAVKSEFSRIASSIGKDISNTSLKLNKLAQLAKRKTLFDDRPVEISELTFIVKQDIANINKQIAALQNHVKQGQASTSIEGKQIDEHNRNVIMLLQSKLASISMTFKDVLEVRTQLQARNPLPVSGRIFGAFSAYSHGNIVLYGSKTNPDPMGDGSPAKFDPKGKGRAAQNGDVLALDLDSAEEGSANGGAFQQMQLIEQQDSYIQQRSSAIESIETTIAELGQIFTQLAHMVAEQRETVQRIDADTQDIADNVRMGHNELLKYWGRVSNDRWLMLKVFGVLIVFSLQFLLFILVS